MGRQFNDLDELRQLVTETPSGCWVLKDDSAKSGYVRIVFRGKAMHGHRAALFATTGIPPGYMACHKCANKRCVRPHPDHVYAGSCLRNIMDTVEHVAAGKQADHWEANRQRVAAYKKNLYSEGTV